MNILHRVRKKAPIVLLTIAAATFIILQSCRKVEGAHPEKKQNYSLLSGTAAINEAFVRMRNQARVEFNFHFGDYHHRRDFLQSVDWDHAILNTLNGHKVMVFKFEVNNELQTDARLMVVQGDGGRNTYSIRIQSRQTAFTSVYVANTKMMYVGKVEHGVFNILSRTKLKGAVTIGTGICEGCHSGDDGWDDPVPGHGGSIYGNNWLGEVTIEEPAGNPVVVPDDYWDGPIAIIPGAITIPIVTHVPHLTT